MEAWFKGKVTKYPPLVRWARNWCDVRIIAELPIFVPASAGSRQELADLGLQATSQTFPFMTDLLSLRGTPLKEPTPIDSFADSDEKRNAAAELKVLFDRFGSDKGTTRYHMFYGSILVGRAVSDVLEVGLGTNNPSVVSNMGEKGQPGASLRAFRDFLPGARMYGADVDRDILFEEERIRTFFVDQTDPQSFLLLSDAIGHDLDLIIDDGLHSPNANIATLFFGLQRLKVGGWLIIEDIPNHVLPVWQVVAALLPEQFESHVVAAQADLLFTVKRLR